MRAAEAAVSTVTDVVGRLGADCSAGLTEEEVERRRKLFGKNEFVIKKEEPLWRKYLNQVRTLEGRYYENITMFYTHVCVRVCSSLGRSDAR